MKVRYRLCMGLCLAVLMILNVSAVSRADNDEYIDGLRESISEKENELDGLESQKAALQSGRSNLQRIVNGLEATKNEMASYVAELDAQVAEIQGNIDSLNELIEAKEAEIVQTQEELAQAEQVAADQYEAMKERIQFMYEQGDTLYLEMLLNSDSFADMLNKADYIEQLSAYDRRKLEEYQLVIEYTELCRQELVAERELLEEAKVAAQEEQNNLNALIDEKEVQITAYESDIATKEQAIREYDAEIAEQNQIIAALEAQIAADQAALAEATRLKYDGGIFIWPAPSYTRISDPFGWRMHPTLGVEKFHNGLDMAAPGGSPILAAYDGKVVAAGYSSSMGNYIMIDHGDKLYTIYMHASALYVSTGEYVTRGQKIAAVGTTGRSTGNHLHFGVRLNGQYVDPRSYL
ncbi:MAG: peptidoglycan DD-metalloendopeptidase family protein [Lachnospiraceae bacterium]|nr:peptidoglycan DD-metalloendopeptidase family protein [Lachnospiraceae bacterium]